jgi:hypothetical protein
VYESIDVYRTKKNDNIYTKGNINTNTPWRWHLLSLKICNDDDDYDDDDDDDDDDNNNNNNNNNNNTGRNMSQNQ